jgi:hypothetical protein
MNRQEFEKLRDVVRPKIKKLANENQLIDETFEVVCASLFPDYPDDVKRNLKTAFVAGAGELLAILTVGVTNDDNPTEDDYRLFTSIATEIEKRHDYTVELAFMKFGKGN